MTVCPVSTVVAADHASDVTFTTVTASNIREECSAKITGSHGPVDLIALAGMDEFTVTVLSGDGPSASAGRTYTVPKGGCTCISVSTGEALRADGTFHFLLEAEGAFSTLKPKIAVIQHRNVLTH